MQPVKCDSCLFEGNPEWPVSKLGQRLHHRQSLNREGDEWRYFYAIGKTCAQQNRHCGVSDTQRLGNKLNLTNRQTQNKSLLRRRTGSRAHRRRILGSSVTVKSDRALSVHVRIDKASLQTIDDATIVR